jgi:hypothetical protein
VLHRQCRRLLEFGRHFHVEHVLSRIAEGLRRPISFLGVSISSRTMLQSASFAGGEGRHISAAPSGVAGCQRISRFMFNARSSRPWVVFDLNYKTAADYDWMLRACELHEFRSRYLDSSLVDMQNGGSSTAGLSAWVRGNLESLRARRRQLGSGLVDPALIAKPLRKLSQFTTRLAVRQQST